ncbi:tetratricopeptide repeat protein [Caenimonas soli]|uniref:tetratricopeptide repeat protein n=1 Tax=Caenimonas soli TaxID=2735555 RepID=UPI001553B415|nr:tetratricopeptide repeat protein [Caenimonas soli]NPC55676.1 tetratricopeptide repeat protein [Caenimonas soli]
MSFMEQGVALLGAGRFHEALQQFAQGLRQQPLAIEPRLGLAQSCQGVGDGWTATAWLSDACRVAPQRPELWWELAKALTIQKREPELETLLGAALVLHPDHAGLLQAQAELYLRNKRYAKALPVYTQLRGLHPKDPVTLLHCGFCLEQLGEAHDAAVLYREALAQHADFLEAHVDLAGVLWRLGDFDGALAHAKRAVELGPQHPYAVRVLGMALLNLNRVEEAKQQLRRALELQPGFALAEIDLAFGLLLEGRLQEGWAMYARRWRDTDRMRRPSFFDAQLEWQGPRVQPLQGKRIGVYAEQGLGDVIQFIRYVPLMQADGASVFGVIPPDLVPLLEHSIPGLQCLRPDTRFEVDYHVALLDLPMHYGTTLENIPANLPYLRAQEDKASVWRERLSAWDGKLKVGIAWAGSGQQVNNGNRSVYLSELAPLMHMPGVQCFSLQKGDGGPMTDAQPGPEQLADLTAHWNDFTDSAAMLQNLDLVITVDTAVAHLAGAMGRPVWVMLAPNADWRWLLDRADSPWYPGMRLFRRGFGEARAAQVGRVAAALQARWGKGR